MNNGKSCCHNSPHADFIANSQDARLMTLNRVPTDSSRQATAHVKAPALLYDCGAIEGPPPPRKCCSLRIQSAIADTHLFQTCLARLPPNHISNSQQTMMCNAAPGLRIIPVIKPSMQRNDSAGIRCTTCCTFMNAASTGKYSEQLHSGQRLSRTYVSLLLVSSYTGLYGGVLPSAGTL